MRSPSTVAQLTLLSIIGTFIGCASNTPTAPSTRVATSASSVGGVSTGPTLDAGAVEFEGVISATDAGSRSITVAGVVVTIPATTPIRHGDRPLQFSDLHLGDRVDIHATRSGATLVATSVNDETEPGEVNEADDNDRADHDADEDDHATGTDEGPNHDTGDDRDGSNRGSDDGGGHDGHGGSGRH